MVHICTIFELAVWKGLNGTKSIIMVVWLSNIQLDITIEICSKGLIRAIDKVL